MLRGAVAALLLAALAVAVVAGAAPAAALCPQARLPSLPPAACTSLPRVCVDHSVFVLYGNAHNPRHEAFAGLPALRLANISLDYFGFRDAWGTSFPHPGPLLRPATSGEETRELAAPAFSQCTVPLVLYSHRVYRLGDFFLNTVAPLNMLQLNHTLDKRLTLVVETFGMRLAPFHRFLLSPFTQHRVTTLSHLSSRVPLPQEEGYNPDGQHVRCFRQLLLCQMRGAGSAAAAALAASAPVPSPLWSTGQAVFQHYKHALPAIDPAFADASKLRVLIAALPRRPRARAFVNQEQVWSWCNKFQPPQGVANWNGTACLLHEFGRNLLSDLAYASQADVLLGLHSDALFNAFFMRQHSSVVEVRPRGWSGPDASATGLQEVAAADGHSVLWWGINVVDPAHSAPGHLEAQRRGAPHTWPRHRHVFLRLMAAQYVLERVALARGSLAAYQQFRARHEHLITDALQPARDDGELPADAAGSSSSSRGGGGEDLLAAATAAAAAAGAGGGAHRRRIRAAAAGGGGAPGGRGSQQLVWQRPWRPRALLWWRR